MKGKILAEQYHLRLEKIREWMVQEGIDLVMFEDTESRRDSAIRWLCGQPGDSLLFLSRECKTLLVPWDINLANIYAQADALIPYGDFDRLPEKAIKGAIRKLKIPQGSRIEIPANTPYPLFLHYTGELGDYDILCRENCAVSYAKYLRAVKDEQEIKVMRQAAEATNRLIDNLEKDVRNGKIKTEADAALMIELCARKLGCEGTGFETLAAGPDRSFAIHAFPSWTDAAFGSPGLSILDFGLKLNGYTTDVSLTFVREPNAPQEKMVNAVEQAYQLALSMAHNGAATKKIASCVDSFLTKHKKSMPHALGHGIGLEEHEYPALRNRSDNEWALEPRMVFTLEPGLYDPLLGGCRLENDILMTEAGPEVLTQARIIRL